MAVAPLSNSDSAIKVSNAALNVLGLTPISSFLDNNLKARTLNVMYADAIEEALSVFPWRFNRAQAVLARLADNPPANWEGIYAKPSGALIVHKVMIDDSDAQFDVFENGIAVNVSSTSTAVVKAEYGTYQTPDKWPGYFRLAAIWHLASQIAMPITQDERTAENAMRVALSKIALARSRDAQGRTPSKVDTSLFIRAKRGGRRSI